LAEWWWCRWGSFGQNCSQRLVRETTWGDGSMGGSFWLCAGLDVVCRRGSCGDLKREQLSCLCQVDSYLTSLLEWALIAVWPGASVLHWGNWWLIPLNACGSYVPTWIEGTPK
jgi:hypothetical protein